jgi:hypothetical protein
MKAIIPSVIFYSSCIIAAGAAPIDYDTQVRPFLKDNCIACHNKTTTKGGLNMETPELMTKGGESDVGIIPGKGAESIMYQAAAHTWDSEMPPKGNKVGAVNLTTQQLAMFKEWIDQGAKASPKKIQVIAWEPLPAGVQPIYALAATAQGDFIAAARANQISLYHLPTHSLVTKLTDESLIKSGLYKQSGVAHRDLVQSLAFSPDGTRLATGSFREVKLWKRETKPPQRQCRRIQSSRPFKKRTTRSSSPKRPVENSSRTSRPTLSASNSWRSARWPPPAPSWKSRIKTRPSRKRRPMPRSRRIV